MIERQKVKAALDDLHERAKLLARYRSLTLEEILEDPDRRGGFERYFEVCLQKLLDIGAHLLAGAGHSVPEEYKEVLKALGKAGILEPGFAARIEGMAGLRNILAHDYAHLNHAVLYQHLTEDFGDFCEFARQVVEYLDRTAPVEPPESAGP